MIMTNTAKRNNLRMQNLPFNLQNINNYFFALKKITLKQTSQQYTHTLCRVFNRQLIQELLFTIYKKINKKISI